MSLAKTSASQVRASVWQASAADCGASTHDSFARFDPDSSSWRTSQRCLVEGWATYSETWPRSGMTLSGTAYRLAPLVRLIEETGSGSLLPTPTAQDAEAAGGDGCTDRGARGMSLHQAGKRGLIPTPTAGDANSSGGRGGLTYKGHAGVSLTDWARGDINTGRRPMIPTPGASDWRNGADYSDRSRGKSPQLRDRGTGLLNPRFVEWMMGYESGWSEPD